MKRLLTALWLVCALAICLPMKAGQTVTKFIAGVNFPFWNYSTDFGSGPWGKYTNWVQINQDMANLHNQGVTHVAWELFGDGRYSPDFRLDGTSFLDAEVLPDIDRAMKIAHDNQIVLMFDLINASSMWGKPNSNFGAPFGGHSNMVTDTNVRHSFLGNCLLPVVKRIYNSPYRASVDTIDLLTEPEWVIRGFGGQYPALDGNQVRQFVILATNIIHQNAPGLKVTVGAATPYWAYAWIGTGVDFYSFHYYPWMDFGRAPGSGLPALSALPHPAAFPFDRPVWVTEYATRDVNYTIGSTVPLSAQWYLDTIPAKGYSRSYAWATSFTGSAENWPAFAPVYTNWQATH